MGVEIERKFLLANTDWKKSVSKSISIKQGYLNSTPERTVRVRITNDEAYITIKSKAELLSRAEFEYIIPQKEALELLQLCEKPLIEKTRHIVVFESHTWEIDVFDGDNLGLTLAEIELNSESEEFTKPNWIGAEVSDDKRYYNSSLIKLPFKS